MRIAVVGMGGFAQTHLRDVVRVEAAGLGRHIAQVAIAADRATFAAEIHDLEARQVPIFASLRQMLAACRNEIDLVCIPTACGSFESAAIGEIPDEFRRIDAESGRVEVEGMTDLVLGAYESASLFSELNIGWAKQGEKINLEGYDYFPAFRTDLILFEKAG